MICCKRDDNILYSYYNNNILNFIYCISVLLYNVYPGHKLLQFCVALLVHINSQTEQNSVKTHSLYGCVLQTDAKKCCVHYVM